MKRTLLALLAFVFIFASCDFQDPNTAESDDTESAALGATASAAGKMGGFAGLPGKGAVLRLKGTGDQVNMDIPDFDGAFCFTVDLFDAASGNKVGQATDCLTEITPHNDDLGLTLTGTTIFDFGNGHTFTSRGTTTVQPIEDGVPFTHITGAIATSGNSIIEGTGVFKNFGATVRLSGAVNLDDFTGAEDGSITFDCLFNISLL